VANIQLSVKVFAALAVVLVATVLCGRLALRVKQPRVVGEMVAGVLLGPSLLGWVAPGAQHALFPDDVKGVLYVLSTIGLTFFMFLVGTGIDHAHTTRQSVGRASVLAVSGIVPTFVIAAGVAAVFYTQLAAKGSTRWEFMLFIGGALSITAFPTLARILDERGVTNTRIGSLTLVAAAVDDAVAWMLLAVIVAVGSSGSGGDAVFTIAGAAVFALVMLTVGRKLLRKLGDRVERDGGLRTETTAIILFVVLLSGWFTDYIGVFSVFGGFVAGMAMPRSEILRQEMSRRLADFNAILLLPVFFAFSGLNTNLAGIADGSGMIPAMVAILVAAVVGKYVGCGLTVRLQGFSWRYASAVGGLMNARGLMILIFINIGLTYHLITPAVFAMLVVVAIVTTGAALPIYRASMSPWMEEAEIAATRLPTPTPGTAHSPR
jgi:Kef-type K+ transport system membrane component KefB